MGVFGRMSMNSRQRWMGGVVLLSGGVLLAALLLKGKDEIHHNQMHAPETAAESGQKNAGSSASGLTVDVETEKRLLEAQRLKLRTDYDLELIEELGFCKGIENYSRHLSGRLPGSAPSTLLDFFPKDSLTLIDESHVAVPQLGGMYEGDRSRKNILVEHGFRLPSALDNRPAAPRAASPAREWLGLQSAVHSARGISHPF